MSDNKKYYWLKLKSDFFVQKAIKKLRTIAGGDTYTIIYLKMQLKSLEGGGILYHDGFEDDFPSELALDIDESKDNVEMTLNFLRLHKLIEFVPGGEKEECHIPAVNENTGRDKLSTDRVRKYREKKKALKDETQHETFQNVSCNTELEKEIEIDIEKDKKNVAKSKDLTPYLPLANLLYTEHLKKDPGYLQGKNIEKTLNTWGDSIRLLVELDKRPIDLVKRVILWAKNHSFWSPNIISGKKLRSQFPTLFLQMNNGNRKASGHNFQNDDYHKQNKGF